MNFSSFQNQRAHLIRWYQSALVTFVVALLVTLSMLSLLVLLLGLIINLPVFYLGLAFVFLPFGLLAISFGAYITYIQNHPSYLITPILRQKNPLNNFDFLPLEALERLAKTKNWTKFWQVLTRDQEFFELFYRLGLSPHEVGQLLVDQVVDDKVVSALVADCLTEAEGSLVTVFHLLKQLTGFKPVHQFLSQNNLTDADVDLLIRYYHGRRQLPTTRLRTGGFAKSWAVSYTNLLDTVAAVVPFEVVRRAQELPIYSRQAIVDQMVTDLTKSQGQNVILVGPTGVGKTELFYHFASLVESYRTKTALDGKDVRVLDVQRLLASVKSAEALGRVMNQLLTEIIQAGNVILFIDQIDLLLSPDSKVGSADLGNVLQAYLENDQISLIAAISNEKYLELIKPSSFLSRSFTPIEVTPPDQEELLGIVLSQAPVVEQRYGVLFLLSSLKELLELAKRYIKDEVSPAREITLLDQVGASVHSRNQVVVAPEAVEAIVEQKAKVPIQVSAKEHQTLLHLADELHRRIVGQDYAVQQVSDALIRARAGLTSGTKPLGTFLFLGPTGVGKTETAKALAATYYGDQNNIIRLDMSEYADTTGLAKLLGEDQAKQPGALALAIQAQPSSVLLLDEIEKSSLAVRNAFLQLLDEGKLTTNYGKVLDFSNTIVIATSNAGSDFIRSAVAQRQTVQQFSSRLIDQLIAQNIFLTEFLNRFDGVIIFAPLNQGQISQIVQLHLNELTQRIQKEKGIGLVFGPEVVRQLAIKGYDPVFGARALERVITQELETVIAKQIIAENTQPGSTLTINSL